MHYYYVAVNLAEIKEIRRGKKSIHFENWPDEATKYEDGQCFVLLYGIKFCLSSLSVACNRILQSFDIYV